jgi:hypothetical protein
MPSTPRGVLLQVPSFDRLVILHPKCGKVYNMSFPLYQVIGIITIGTKCTAHPIIGMLGAVMLEQCGLGCLVPPLAVGPGGAEGHPAGDLI